MKSNLRNKEKIQLLKSEKIEAEEKIKVKKNKKILSSR